MIHSGLIPRWSSACWMLLLAAPIAAQTTNSGAWSLPSSALKVPRPQHRAVTPTPKASASDPAADEADRAIRMDIAADLNKCGVKVDWQKYDLLALLDIDSRVESGRHLREMGVAVDWKQYDSATLTDMEVRVDMAHELKQQGLRVDWRKHDLLTLVDLQTRSETSRTSQPNKTAAKTSEYGGGNN